MSSIENFDFNWYTPRAKKTDASILNVEARSLKLMSMVQQAFIKMIKRIHPRSSCTNSSSMFSFSEGKRFCFNEKQQDANTISIFFSFLNFTCFEPFSNIKSWLTLNPFFHNIEKVITRWHESKTFISNQIDFSGISDQIHQDLGYRRWASWSKNNKFLLDVYEDESLERMGKILWRTRWLLPPQAKGSGRVWFEKPLWP